MRLVWPTVIQAADLFGVCARYVSLMLRATEEERRAMVASPHASEDPRRSRMLTITDADLDAIPEQHLRAALDRRERRRSSVVSIAQSCV